MGVGKVGVHYRRVSVRGRWYISKMAAWSPSSSSLSSKSLSPRNVKGLNATIFGMNRLSIRDGPRNVIKCLDADRLGQNGSGPLSRQLYLNEGLATADRMYTTDMIGHHSCVNTIALSNRGEQFLVSGEILKLD